MSEIRIAFPKNWRASYASQKVYINHHYFDTIKRGQCIQLYLAPGQKSIRVGKGRGTGVSNTILIDLEETSLYSFVVERKGLSVLMDFVILPFSFVVGLSGLALNRSIPLILLGYLFIQIFLKEEFILKQVDSSSALFHMDISD